jgi:hypothetical protein
MGLGNSNSGGQYVRFKEGKFSLSSSPEDTYTELEGQITGIRLTNDEFKGNVIPKLNLTVSDSEGDNYILSVGFNTSIATGLIGFLKNADLSSPLTLVGVNKKGEDGVEKAGILVKQDGAFLKGYYSKTTPNGLPQMKQVIVNKQKIWDKSEMVEFLENVVREELAPAITGSPAAPKPKKEKNTVMDEDLDETLPF